MSFLDLTEVQGLGAMQKFGGKDFTYGAWFVEILFSMNSYGITIPR